MSGFAFIKFIHLLYISTSFLFMEGIFHWMFRPYLSIYPVDGHLNFSTFWLFLKVFIYLYI